MERLYGWQGHAHAALARRIGGAAAGERGQGTVEYVGLILLVAVILAGVVKASGGLKDTRRSPRRWSRSSRARSTRSGKG